MEEGNLTSESFLKEKLGLDLSKTLLIMDDSEDFANSVEQGQCAEVTRH